MSFPYTQCISGITIPAGSFINTTFVVAAYQSGISVGQFTPNPTPPNYTLGGVSNLDNSGGSTTAIEFLLNYGDTSYSPPYYFVYGSNNENIWLNSITPATGGNQFTSSNVTTQISEHSEPDAAIAGLFYYYPANLLYVAASNGNLYWYSVSWPWVAFEDGVEYTGGPTLTYVGSNTSYTGETAVSLTFFPSGTLTDYDCLLLGGVSEATGVIFNAENPSSNPSLYGYLAEYCSPMVYSAAVCRGPKGLYFATPSGVVHYQPYSGFDAGISPIWTVPNGQVILSLAYSPNSGQADGSNYPNGAVFIATAPSNPGNSSMGSMWVCDVNTNRVGNAAQQSQSISGSPWATIADANLNYLCATGSSGVFHSTLAAYSPSSSIPENGMLVANDPTSGVHHEWISDIVSAAALVFGVVTDDPVAVGWAITGIVAGAVDSKTGY
jgi:hypothetical protein